jgi:misacylated tRNA(Ala) deacylase
MQQHTAQHLLTALAHDRMGWATTAFHLGPQRSDIELDTGAPAPKDLATLERLANEAVREAGPVRVRQVEPEALADLPVRTRGLPEGHTGPVRLVDIEGIDTNTCGGTHVRNLAELQAVKLVGTEKAHGGTRLLYLAGGRVLSGLGACLDRERALTRLLDRGPDEHVAGVERLQADLRAAERARRDRLRAMASLIARELAASDRPAAAHHLDEADFGFFNAVAGTVADSRPDLVVLLTAGDPEGEGLFLVAGPDETVAALGPRVAEVLEARGGGRAGRFQGRATRLDRRPEALALLSRGSG